MLRSIKDLNGCKVRCMDGHLGAVAHVYFDDETWGIRFIVIEATGWNDWQEVWVSPFSVKSIDFDAGIVSLNLTQRQMTGSPSVDSKKPVSRLQEFKLFDYYGCWPYWAPKAESKMTSRSARSDRPLLGLESLQQLRPTLHVKGSRIDIHLLNAKQAGQFSVETSDGTIGHVAGFVFDDETWVVRYLTVDTRDWWNSSREVLLSTGWIESVDAAKYAVKTLLTRDSVEHSPAYVEALPLNRVYETQLHNFYGREAYWSQILCALLTRMLMAANNRLHGRGCFDRSLGTCSRCDEIVFLDFEIGGRLSHGKSSSLTLQRYIFVFILTKMDAYN